MGIIIKYPSIFEEHREQTKKLAKSLKAKDVYNWLIESGYFPESYILPPCFRVMKRPSRMRLFSKVHGNKFKPALKPKNCCNIHFPKSNYTDRIYGIIHPDIHNDIAYHIARNWNTIVDCVVPKGSNVTCYSFPVPINTKRPGRIGFVRSGRMIYEFLIMTEEDLTSVSYLYSNILRADIKSFYPSIYTHSISWAMHGKKRIRKHNNRWNLSFPGNRLDRLFQFANDQKTNGIPVGPAVSDVVAEMVAAAVDCELTRLVKANNIKCEMTRFKDDYRILVRNELEGRRVIKLLQVALKNFDLELSDDKCSIQPLPQGLFRPWVSAYHQAYPKHRNKLKWKEFRELFISAIRIDELHPNTGVLDRFLADIVSKGGKVKVDFSARNLRKTMSMLLMLGNRRVKCFPKVLAIIESILRTPFGRQHTSEIVSYLVRFLEQLSQDEASNAYLISWMLYFMVSNDLKKYIRFTPQYFNVIPRTVFKNRSSVFTDSSEFKLFEGSQRTGKRHSMLEYLEVFNPPSR